MAINPLSVPNFGGPYSGGADFAPLGNLGNVMQAQQDRQRQLAALGQLGTDPTQNAMALIKSNDPRLAQTGLELMQNLTRQKYQEAQQAESVRQFNLEQQDREARLKLAQEEAQRGKFSGPIQYGTKTDPATGETKTVGIQRDARTGEYTEVEPPKGISLLSPEEMAIQKSQKNLDEIRNQQEAIRASARTIESADRAEKIARAAIHLPFHMAEPIADVWQFAKGMPGQEAAVATKQLAQDALQNMIGQVKGTFGGRSSTKQDQWLKDAQAAPNQSLDFQLGVINRGRDLAKENQWISQQTAEDMKTGKYYKPGYVDPALRVPKELQASGDPIPRSGGAGTAPPAGVPPPVPTGWTPPPRTPGGTAPPTANAPGTLPPGFASAGLGLDPSAISKEDIAREIARRRREGK